MIWQQRNIITNIEEESYIESLIKSVYFTLGYLLIGKELKQRNLSLYKKDLYRNAYIGMNKLIQE